MKILNILFSVLILYSCQDNNSGYKYNHASFSETPTNFWEINTAYDDYNASSPIFGETFPLIFSSNRNSNGANFDIVYHLVSIEFSRAHGTLDVFKNTSYNLGAYIENANINGALQVINSNQDELGPYLIPQGRNPSSSNINGRYESYVLLYSTNINGDQDIMFTENLSDENYETPISVKLLNSAFDDAYPCYNQDLSALYFTSNRDSKFDIYKLPTDNSKDIIEMLTEDSSTVVQKDTILSSSSDDKCPFISNKLMVFSSNRAGGYGGFDLYFSKFEHNKWTAPENFGSEINTEYDEYRPILRPQGDFTNDFMLFSSNRPGGKGGYDLYYVGIEKIPN